MRPGLRERLEEPRGTRSWCTPLPGVQRSELSVFMPRVLVTGGCGFIGSHVAEDLLRRGHLVTVLDDLSGGFTDNLVDGIRFVKGDITDRALVDDLFGQGRFDYVYHLAAYAAEGLSPFIKRFNYNNNLIGSVTLINASITHSVKCFVFTSSIAVYGTSPNLPLREDSPTNPDDSYGIAKLAVENELRTCKQLFDLDYVIFRPHNVYGERQNIGDKYRNVVGIFMNQILQGQPMTVFGDGEQVRAFSYIGDIAPLLAEAIDVPGAYNETFNIGADRPYTVNHLATAVARAMDAPANVRHLPPRHEAPSAYSDHSKIARVFGHRSTHSLEEGLARMAGWAREHGPRQSQVFGDIEVTKNFPAGWLPST
jgi:UDP-glucose 4-epimerase